MKIKINKAVLKGNVLVPSSKSLSHRAIISSCLAGGGSVSNLIFSSDVIATLEGMKVLGFDYKIENDKVNISKTGEIGDVIDCVESGSTMRFLIPIALTLTDKMTFIGRNNLVNRPLDVFFDIFNNQDIKFEHGATSLPLTVYDKLKSGEFYIPGNVSSQFITGLLFSLPLLDGDSVINVIGHLESKGYIDLTIDVLKKYNIEIINNDYASFIIKGNQKYHIFNYSVEGDFSQAAFWLVYGTLNGGVKLDGMNINSLQGDKEIIEIIEKMGGEISFEGGLEAKKRETHGAIIDLSQAPDLGPIITVLAALSLGETRIINASRLRIKECDRIHAMTVELNSLGADIIETEDGMIINGVSSLRGGTVYGWNDHRIVMALAIASSRCSGPVIIKGAEAINKSYPHFFEQFKALGGDINELDGE